MPNLENLKSVIERKSGQRLIACDAQELRVRLGYDINSMRQNGFDPSVIEEHEVFNDRLETVFSNSEIVEYLSSLTPEDIYMASGVRVLTIDSIKEEIQRLVPGALLFPYGYLPIASSICGNVVCFHAPTNQIVWAGHDSFYVDLITFEDQTTKEWREIPFTSENIVKALVPLASDLKTFLTDLLNDKLEKQLDKLD